MDFKLLADVQGLFQGGQVVPPSPGFYLPTLKVATMHLPPMEQNPRMKPDVEYSLYVSRLNGMSNCCRAAHKLLVPYIHIFTCKQEQSCTLLMKSVYSMY